MAVQFRLMPVPVGIPKIHPGALVGLRLICAPEDRPPLCVILCSESGGCMRLEVGGHGLHGTGRRRGAPAE